MIASLLIAIELSCSRSTLNPSRTSLTRLLYQEFFAIELFWKEERDQVIDIKITCVQILNSFS